MKKVRLLNEFLELVQIDSETKDEAKIAKVLKEKMEALGFYVKEDNSAFHNGLGVAVMAKTLFSLKDITFAFLCKSGLIFALITAALEFLSGNMTVFIVSPSTVELTSSPSPAAVEPFTTL